MKTIILDTNFIVDSIKYKIDIKNELDRIIKEIYQIQIIDRTIKELKNMTCNNCLKGKTRNNARLAQQIIEHLKISQIKTNDDKIVDKLILENLNQDTIIATNDKDLIKKLKEKKANIIRIRSKSHYVFENQNLY